MEQLHNSEHSRKFGANILTDQTIAGYIQQQLDQKKAELVQTLADNAARFTQDRQTAYNALNEAVSYVEKVRDFAAPDNLHAVLGNMGTKHGEIAEQIEVQITNGRQVFDGLKKIADIESVHRTAPEDFVIDGVPYQSKFTAGFNNTLHHVTEHIGKYPDFAIDAARYGYQGQAGCYIIPKDQYDTIGKILGGDTGEFNEKTVRACKSFVEKIEEATGKHFTDVVKPSISSYREVQIGTVDKTLDRYEEGFRSDTDERIKVLNRDEQQQAQAAIHKAGPSLAEGAQAAGVAAALGGLISGSIKVYKIIKGGKKITQFTLEDWKEIGVDFGKGAVRGAISGGGIYCLTRLGGFSAPFAGGIVSTGIGIASLFMDYKSGKISSADFYEASCSLSVEAGLSAVGAALGSAIIPVPVIGSVVGAMAARAAIEITKTILGEKEKQLIEAMRHEYEQLTARLSQIEKAELDKIEAYFIKLHGLIAAAFNADVNVRLSSSIELCRTLGVPEKEIIHNEDELDSFMLS